jgi:hypothetical protein
VVAVAVLKMAVAQEPPVQVVLVAVALEVHILGQMERLERLILVAVEAVVVLVETLATAVLALLLSRFQILIRLPFQVVLRRLLLPLAVIRFIPLLLHQRLLKR